MKMSKCRKTVLLQKSFNLYSYHKIVTVAICDLHFFLLPILCPQTGTSIQEHVDAIKSTMQPYLHAVGMKRSSVHEFFIILVKQVIPCKSTSSLGAFDKLFKAHFLFGTRYNQMLHNMYTFIQTTIYNIDIGKVKESPRVAEVWARLLH